MLRSVALSAAVLATGARAYGSGAGTCLATQEGLNSAMGVMSGRSQGDSVGAEAFQFWNDAATQQVDGFWTGETVKVAVTNPDGVSTIKGFLIYGESGDTRVGTWTPGTTNGVSKSCTQGATLTHSNPNAKSSDDLTFTYTPQVDSDVTIKAILYTTSNVFHLASVTLPHYEGTGEPETEEPSSEEPWSGEPETEEPETEEPVSEEPETEEPETEEPMSEEPETEEPASEEPETEEPVSEEPHGTEDMTGKQFGPCRADQSCDTGLVCKSSNVCEYPGDCQSLSDLTVLQSAEFETARNTCIIEYITLGEDLNDCLETAGLSAGCAVCSSASINCATTCTACNSAAVDDVCLRCAAATCGDAYLTCSGIPLPNPEYCSMEGEDSVSGATQTSCATVQKGEDCASITCASGYELDSDIASDASVTCSIGSDFEAYWSPVDSPCVMASSGTLPPDDGSPAATISISVAAIAVPISLFMSL